MNRLSRLTRVSAARNFLFATGILLTVSTSALADTTTLICNTGLPLDMGPTTVDLNEAQSTVTVHLPATTAGIPARTVGPRPATFGPEMITFTDTSNNTDDTYAINRISATVAYTQADLRDHHRVGYANWTCHVGQKQF